MDLDLRLNPPDDDDDDGLPSLPTVTDGKPGWIPQTQWDIEQAKDAYNKAMGWTGYGPGNPLSPADKLLAGVEQNQMLGILQQNTLDATAATEVTDKRTEFEKRYAEIKANQEEAALMQIAEAEAEVSLEDVFERATGEAVETVTEAAQVVAPTPVVAPGELDPVESGFEFELPSAPVTEAVTTPSPGGFSQGAWMGASDEDDWFAGGGRYDDNTAIVGESGPELAIFPRGTEIVPLDRRMSPVQASRLRRRGVRGMAEGGIVFDNPLDNPLPLGIRQLQAGRSLGAPRGQLLRTAGIALPSAQARRRMLPSEREAFQGLGRMAGIPAGEFQQELGITTPSGAPRTGSARMLPLSLRR
jgi:hypothetical protein